LESEEIERLYSEGRLTEFENKIRIHFTDRSLLIKSLSHRSPLDKLLTSKEENLRLGLIGDKLIDLILFEHAYSKGKSSSEMDDLRKKSSSRPSLNKAMREIGVEGHWFLNPGTEANTEKNSAKLGEDTFEALVGAIYLDQGLQKARCFVTKQLSKSWASF
jgi:ribonuclease III